MSHVQRTLLICILCMVGTLLCLLCGCHGEIKYASTKARSPCQMSGSGSSVSLARLQVVEDCDEEPKLEEVTIITVTSLKRISGGVTYDGYCTLLERSNRQRVEVTGLYGKAGDKFMASIKWLDYSSK